MNWKPYQRAYMALGIGLILAGGVYRMEQSQQDQSTPCCSATKRTQPLTEEERAQTIAVWSHWMETELGDPASAADYQHAKAMHKQMERGQPPQFDPEDVRRLVKTCSKPRHLLAHGNAVVALIEGVRRGYVKPADMILVREAAEYQARWPGDEKEDEMRRRRGRALLDLCDQKMKGP